MTSSWSDPAVRHAVRAVVDGVHERRDAQQIGRAHV